MATKSVVQTHPNILIEKKKVQVLALYKINEICRSDSIHR